MSFLASKTQTSRLFFQQYSYDLSSNHRKIGSSIAPFSHHWGEIIWASWCLKRKHLDCLFNSLFWLTTKYASELITIGLPLGEYTGESRSQMPPRHHYCFYMVKSWHSDRWFPLTKASDAEIWRFFDLCINRRLSKQLGRRWFETPSRSLWRLCNAALIRSWRVTCTTCCDMLLTHAAHLAWQQGIFHNFT